MADFIQLRKRINALEERFGLQDIPLNFVIEDDEVAIENQARPQRLEVNRAVQNLPRQRPLNPFDQDGGYNVRNVRVQEAIQDGINQMDAFNRAVHELERNNQQANVNQRVNVAAPQLHGPNDLRWWFPANRLEQVDPAPEIDIPPAGVGFDQE